MPEIKISADNLVAALLAISETENVCLLDSCNVSHLGSRYLIAGIRPVEIHEVSDPAPSKILELLDRKTSAPNRFAFFTLAYEFGLKLEKIEPRPKEIETEPEPDLFLALFDCLIVHDYVTGRTELTGDEQRFAEIGQLIESARKCAAPARPAPAAGIESNFSRSEYLAAIERIKEDIRRGDTYQVNLTRQVRVRLGEGQTPQGIFGALRKNHPAPFAAFIQRPDSIVVSASPERFFQVSGAPAPSADRLISTSPIKGTRPRGGNRREDEKLKNELLASAKDRAENVMIVDLLRNDLGRICRFGTVGVEKLCELEAHPSLFHLVSTVSGALRPDLEFSEIIRAVFPCGSITGAPKISTMRIIDRLETAGRGLSMGAIGFSSNPSQTAGPLSAFGRAPRLDLSVAIRTMVVRRGEAVFNVGGGIVIDSVPEDEYEETRVKAAALLRALGVE